ncbi:hypothetical protein HPB50_017103 [Hyalomma asiaticum]|uniref:Uncharacterized protein n=1 Tax=Hyalomma asiaticum TaxID=266040 RepID=A0ACB7T916_HYAAI|nr:hypothetical protein HPB50_017103 [Hyalomma asiaticum]
MNGEEFPSRNGSTLNGAFLGVSPDVRYLFVCEMPALDMGQRGVPFIKRLTGSDEVTMRAPYVRNRDFHNTAKIVATSSQLPYFKDSERAEITPFLIMPMRSLFMNSIGSVRTNHLMHAVNQHAQNRVFSPKDP